MRSGWGREALPKVWEPHLKVQDSRLEVQEGLEALSKIRVGLGGPSGGSGGLPGCS